MSVHGFCTIKLSSCPSTSLNGSIESLSEDIDPNPVTNAPCYPPRKIPLNRSTDSSSESEDSESAIRDPVRAVFWAVS